MLGSRVRLLSLLGLILFSSILFAQNSSMLTLSAPPPGPLGSKWRAEWEMFLGGNSFSEGKDEGLGALVYFKSNFEYQFAPWLKAKIRPRIDLYAGRAQERYDNDTYRNRIRLIEGYLAVQPVEGLELRAGAINQGFLKSPMLMSSHRGFPGLQQILSSQWGTFKAQLIAQQVVPTSYSLNTDREEKEGLPSFATQSLHLSASYNWLEGSLSAGRFAFNNMPSKVAFESAISGNHVEGEVAPGARFKTGFEGWFGGIEVCACFDSPIQFVGEFQRLTNLKAPSVDADAQSWGFGPRFILGEHEIEIRYRQYFIESDATVGVYNRSFMGNTNRMGENIEFKIDFKDRKFALVGEWINARVIRDNATQKTMTVYYFGVETPYAPF